MKTVTFEPSICKPSVIKKTGAKVPAEYSGTVTIRMPTASERLDFYEDPNATDAEDTDFEVDNEKEAEKVNKRRGRLVMRNAMNQAHLFVQEVAIKRLEDGFKYESFDDLNYDSDMIGVVAEIASRLVGKNRAGVLSTT